MTDWRDDRIGSAHRRENPTVLDAEFLRVNYEILGNSLHVLHVHVHARYAWEPAEYRRGPVWKYPREVRFGAEHALGAAHDGLRVALADALERAAA